MPPKAIRFCDLPNSRPEHGSLRYRSGSYVREATKSESKQ